MKTKLLKLLALTFIFVILSCKKEDPETEGIYIFKAEYLATVTVGGVIGVVKNTFEAGETIKGIDKGGNSIIINKPVDNITNQEEELFWNYAESIEVPKEYLELSK